MKMIVPKPRMYWIFAVSIYYWFWNRLPDLDVSVRQDLPVAGPAAMGGAVVAGRLGNAYWTEAWLLQSLAQVFKWGQLMVPWLETKPPYPVDLHKWVVELLGTNDGWEIDERAVEDEDGWIDGGTDVPPDVAQGWASRPGSKV